MLAFTTMEPPTSEADQDGTQRWFAGLPSVGVIPPEEVTDVHRATAARALAQVRRHRWMLIVGAVGVLFLLGMLLRSPGLICPALPLLILTTVFAPRAIAKAWRLRELAHFIDERGIHGTVERFEGHTPFASRREFLGEIHPEKSMSLDGTGPRFLRLDVLTEVGLVLSVAEQHPPRTTGGRAKPLVDAAPNGVHVARVQTTSDRMAGTEQGLTRPLAANERVELPDLARHDPSWRALLPVTPALFPVLFLVRSLFGWIGMWVALLLTLLVAFGVVVRDVVEARRRRRYIQAAQQVLSVLGGVNREGEQVEVLLPDKLLWTVSGRPAPDRLRERSRALSDKLGERHVPTTF